nr:hypothetical protein BCU36_00830 [Vibrio lentus]
MKTSNALYSILILSLISSFLMLTFNPLRLLFIFNTFSVFIAFNFLLTCIVIVIGLISLDKLRFEFVEIVMLAILVTLLVNSFLSLHEFSTRNIILDFLKPIVFILTVCIFRNCFCEGKLSNSSAIKTIPNLMMLVTVSMVIISIAISKWYTPMYPAYTTIESTLAFNSANPLQNIIYGFWLFIGGKRGVFLAFIAVFFIYIFVNSDILKKLLFSFLALLFTLIVLALFGESIATIFLKVNSFSDIKNMNFEELATQLGGGRLSETTSSLSYIHSLKDILFGGGLGFEYIVQQFGDQSGEMHRNVHFSPVSLFTIYGGLFTLLFYAYIFKYLLICMNLMQSGTHPKVTHSIIFYFFCSVIFSFTEYVFFSYSNIAISMGIIGLINKSNKSKRKHLCVE